jgi:hypothetical protein
MPRRGPPQAAVGPAYLTGFAPGVVTGVPRSMRDVVGGAFLAGFAPDVLTGAPP